MEEALRARLLGAAGLTAIVDRRVDWGVRAQGAPMPAVTLNVITGAATMHMAGPDGWDRARNVRVPEAAPASGTSSECWSRK